MKRELDWIGNRARLFPDDAAIVSPEEQAVYSFSELNDRAEKLARFFLEKGIQKGDRVALLAPNHISYFDFLFASMKTGTIFVPLNWRLSRDDMSYVLKDAKPSIIGIHDQFQNDSSWISKYSEVLFISNHEYIPADTNSDLNISEQHLPAESDPLAMIYTGGTTGKPKGAVLTHRSILWNAINTIISWDLAREDTTLTSLPMFHTGGLNALTLPVLLAGGKVVINSYFDPEKALEDLIKYKCSIVLFVPTMYHMIIQTEAFQKAEFPHMKVFLSGGAPCPLHVYDAFDEKGLKFKEGYGLTEAGPNNFYIDPDEARRKKGSVGKAMMFNEIKIVKENGEEAAINEVGELCLRGNHAFECYWNNEEATRDTLRNGWLYTGDLARKDEEGFVYIVGRKKEMIITGGENVYPLEIEHWLLSHEWINEAAVVGLPDEKWGEQVTAFVSLVDGVQLSEQELKDYCRKKLSRYKIPKKFYFMDELPKTHVGKINKKALIDHYSEHSL
ncbi:MAG: long-chain fatty acid--CoA ligase [Bacillaceae bacterium]|nr:long-chain fatty acid--CoA ligase [Bacillaceae bacterium]